jgi:phosphoglycolate phosphatase-like HAD superfamily hydrolase
MVPGVQEMLKKLGALYPMCTITTGTAPRVEKFLAHYGVLDNFKAVVGAQTTRRMKPHPEPLLCGECNGRRAGRVLDDWGHDDRYPHWQVGRSADARCVVRLWN